MDDIVHISPSKNRSSNQRCSQKSEKRIFPTESSAAKRPRTSSPRKSQSERIMAPTVESQYKDLLNPIKDPEKSFAVNIADLLQNFVAEFTGNFNSAALLLQGSASIYGKKVEYLHNLATQLHNNLSKQKKDENQENKKETKERQKKEEKLHDPFLSVDFKIGKNLSCLRKKNTSKATAKKSAKKFKSSNIPIHLLSNDNEDKGEVFYDTRGEIVGNKGDFAINKCRLISSGWLLLPTVNPALAPSLAVVPDYYDDSDMSEPCDINLDDIEIGDPIGNDCVTNGIQQSPDEGFESGPQSSDAPLSTPVTDINSENINTESPIQSSSSVPPSTDGISSTNDIEASNGVVSNDVGASNNDIVANGVEECDSPGTAEGNENIPADNEQAANSSQVPQPVRQSVRQALKPCQLAVEDDPLAGLVINKELLVRKKIQKKNCVRLPAKLRMAPGEEEIVPPISLFCAQTFFTLEERGLKKSLLNFDVIGFDQNSRFVDRMLSRLAILKTASKKKFLDPIEDELEINLEEVECLQEANESDDTLCAPFDDNDIQIDHDICPPMEPKLPPPPPMEVDNADVPEVPAPDGVSPQVTQITEEFERHIQDLNDFIQNSDITKRVHEWEENVKPFLDELDQRESFDINLYGSRILNAFEDNNRKQTMTFRQFCKNKEKWEIHRYFMALLPLANIGNVSIESEPKEDGTEEIFVTLLSRKMHHKELEEFGHNDGSHS